MTFTVQYKRFFEEFGFCDCDYLLFDNLSDAYKVFTELHQKQERQGDVKLLQGDAINDPGNTICLHF